MAKNKMFLLFKKDHNFPYRTQWQFLKIFATIDSNPNFSDLISASVKLEDDSKPQIFKVSKKPILEYIKSRNI